MVDVDQMTNAEVIAFYISDRLSKANSGAGMDAMAASLWYAMGFAQFIPEIQQLAHESIPGRLFEFKNNLHEAMMRQALDRFTADDLRVLIKFEREYPELTAKRYASFSEGVQTYLKEYLQLLFNVADDVGQPLSREQMDSVLEKLMYR